MTVDRVSDVRCWLGAQLTDTTVLLRNLTSAQARRLEAPTGLLIERTRCPRVSLQANAVPPPFKKKLDYYRRRLEAAGVRFVFTEPGKIAPAQLDTLFDLHERRWSTTKAGATTRLRDRRTLLLELADRGGEHRGPSLVIAEHGNETIGALLAFQFDGTFSYFQTGWDPDWKSRNIGTALVAAALHHSRVEKFEVFDFLRGVSEYKYKFGAIDEVDETWLYPSGAPGSMLRWKYTIGRRIARQVRR